MRRKDLRIVVLIAPVDRHLRARMVRAGTLAQIATFEGTTPEVLYDLLTTVETHAAITGKPAITRDEKTDLSSIVVLTFRKTASGAQIELVQANVPDYTVRLPDGETGALSALSALVNTLCWDRLRDHLKARSAAPANRK